jgi:hypothetical protein
LESTQLKVDVTPPNRSIRFNKATWALHSVKVPVSTSTADIPSNHGLFDRLHCRRAHDVEDLSTMGVSITVVVVVESSRSSSSVTMVTVVVVGAIVVGCFD